MKKTALIFMIMVLCTVGMVCAQQPKISTTAQEQPQVGGDGGVYLASDVTTPRSERLGEFDKISIAGRMQVTLIRVAEGESAKIYFDTKGVVTSKFKIEIDRKGVLNVTESVDSKRTTVTEVKIYYHDISSLAIAGANVTMEQSFERDMFDVSVTGGATLHAKVNVLDMSMMVTGSSSVVIEGASRYLGLKISTAKFDANALQTMSTIVDASHGAEVSLLVTERLEAATSTSAKVTYRGNPALVRAHSSLFGGDISSADK